MKIDEWFFLVTLIVFLALGTLRLVGSNVGPVKFNDTPRAYYCSVGGYGVPIGELDDPKGKNHIDAPDCKKLVKQ